MLEPDLSGSDGQEPDLLSPVPAKSGSSRSAPYLSGLECCEGPYFLCVRLGTSGGAPFKLSSARVLGLAAAARR